MLYAWFLYTFFSYSELEMGDGGVEWGEYFFSFGMEIAY